MALGKKSIEFLRDRDAAERLHGFGYRVFTARWRWYTVELLGLAGPHTSRPDRSSLNRAINRLAETGEIDVRGSMPYSEVFESDDGFPAAELARIDPRWPHRSGRALWFRIPPPWGVDPDMSDGIPEAVPRSDAAIMLDFFNVGWPDWFADFCGATDREGRWSTPVGRFVTWMFCGHP
jgi:hypothetical protein